jgi:6-phospho-beta-glucosidase
VRGVPEVLEAARQAAEIAPGAWFINMSNPMAILLAALEDVQNIRCLGLCELPALTLEKALALVRATPEEVDVDFLGLNHQGWFVHLQRGGRDLLPEVFAKTGSPEAAAFFQVDPAVMKEIHALPLPYMRLYYHTAREVERLRARASSRGEELSDLSARLYDWYEKNPDSDLPDLIKGRGLVWFRLALVPAVTALLGGGDRLLYVSELNGGDLPGLPADAIVEKKCTLGPDGTKMLPFHGPPPVSGGPLEPFLEFLRKILLFEAAALEAALDPRPERISEALCRHPLGIDARTAEALTPLVLKSVEHDGKSREEEGGSS